MQHGSADHEGAISRAAPETQAQYASLRRALKSAPYGYGWTWRQRAPNASRQKRKENGWGNENQETTHGWGSGARGTRCGGVQRPGRRCRADEHRNNRHVQRSGRLRDLRGRRDGALPSYPHAHGHGDVQPPATVSVSWDTVCSQGFGAGSRSGSFNARTPVTRTIPHPYSRPHQCIVSAGAQLQAGGNSIHVSLKASS